MFNKLFRVLKKEKMKQPIEVMEAEEKIHTSRDTRGFWRWQIKNSLLKRT